MTNHKHQLSLKDTFSDSKAMYMDDVPNVAPYKMSYVLMPSQVASCPNAKRNTS